MHGWSAPAWAHPDDLEHTRPLERAAFLGPFDNLIWDRPRVARLFDSPDTITGFTRARRDMAHAVGCAETTVAPDATDDHTRRTVLRDLARTPSAAVAGNG